MTPANATNPLVEFVTSLQKQVRDELERVASYRFVEPPEPEPPDRFRHRLQWQPATPKMERRLLDIGAARQEMLATMMSYANNPRPGKMLLVKAQPGLGKTFAAILTAQTHTGRVLFLMPTHAHFDQLANFPNFEPADWYHWRATHAPVPGVEGETMCRESLHTRKLMAKGWPLSAACNGLCPLWKANCDYKNQANQPEKIIAGVHEHITTGLDIKGASLVIVDEEPMRAFLQPRTIQAADIATSKFAGPITELYDTLRELCQSGELFQGKPLLDKTGDLLRDVYALIDDFEKLVPAMPQISERGDIDNLPAWFLDDLLVLLAGEWEAWRRGETEWLERVIVRGGALHLMKRGKVWKSVPARVIVIDATANADIYRQMFPDREIEVYEPAVRQRGSIHQIAGSYLGISQMKERETAERMATACRVIADREGYENPGVVTFMSATAAFVPHFGANVAHFGGQRGSNALADCDGGFVVGSFSPPDSSIMDMVKMLKVERLNRFSVTTLENGYIVPIRSERLIEYDHQDRDGRSPWRMVSGLWNDPDLHVAMESRREAEMLQAVHRFRPLTRDVPVWVFSSIPTGLPLSGIWDDPPLGPEGIDWKAWLRIKPKLDEVQAGEAVTIYDLAEWSGVGREWISRNGWLDKILVFYADQWQATKIVRKKGIEKRYL